MWAEKLPLLKRIIPSMRKRAARLVWPNGQGIVQREGTLFLLDLKNVHDRNIFLRGISEHRQRTYFFDAVKQRNCDVFVDIGANIGIYSIFAATLTNCSSVIAYEANELCCDKMRANLLLNGLTRKVKIHNAAVSDHQGTVPFAMSPNGDDLLSKVAEDGSSGCSVRAIKLDDELNLTGCRIAIKMDIEGHELAGIQGMNRLLRDNDCFMQMESWGDKASRSRAMMEALGYEQIHSIDGDYYFAKKK